jgi:hypothetical protein
MIYLNLLGFTAFYVLSFYNAFFEEIEYAIWYAILASMNLSLFTKQWDVD